MKHSTQQWQYLLEHELHDFLYFFLPKVARTIDFEQSAVFFRTPQSILSQSIERPQHNLLLGLQDKDQQVFMLLITLEYGGYDNRTFEQQLFRDLHAVRENIEFKLPVASFVLFLANSIPASMNGYEYDFFDTQIRMNYANYAVREQYFDDLWELKNPITFAVASSRMAIETKEHPSIRLANKKEVLQRLLTRYEKHQFSIERLLHLLEFIAYTLALDNAHEAQFQTHLINTLYHHESIALEDKHRIIQAVSI